MKNYCLACFGKTLLLVWWGIKRSSRRVSPCPRISPTPSTGRRTMTQTEPFQSRYPTVYNGYDVQIAKKLLKPSKVRNLLGQNSLDRFDFCPHFRQDRYDYRCMSPTAERRQEIDFQIATTEVSLLWLLALMVIMPALRVSKTSGMQNHSSTRGLSL